MSFVDAPLPPTFQGAQLASAGYAGSHTIPDQALNAYPWGDVYHHGTVVGGFKNNSVGPQDHHVPSTFHTMKDISPIDQTVWGAKHWAPAQGRAAGPYSTKWSWGRRVAHSAARRNGPAPKPINVNHGPVIPEIWAPLYGVAEYSTTLAVPETAAPSQ